MFFFTHLKGKAHVEMVKWPPKKKGGRTEDGYFCRIIPVGCFGCPGHSALADLITFCLHAGTMSTIKRFPCALILFSSLLDVLLVLLLRRPLSH